MLKKDAILSTFKEFSEINFNDPFNTKKFMQFADLPENWNNVKSWLGTEKVKYYIIKITNKVNDVRVWTI